MNATRTEAESECGPSSVSLGRGDCFVIMPFTDPKRYSPGHFKRVFKDIISQACQVAGFTPVRGDEVRETNLIHLDILTRLAESQMVVCDLSTHNPNVLFELGLRQALNKPVVLIRERGTQRIFDVEPLRYMEYERAMPYHEMPGYVAELAQMLIATDNVFRKGDCSNSLMSLVMRGKPLPFPPAIERSIEEQIHSLPFYRSEVAYQIEVKGMKTGWVTFLTHLSYKITNRTRERCAYPITYQFKHWTEAEVLIAEINGQRYDPTRPDYVYGRGMRIPFTLEPNATAEISLKATEQFRSNDWELYTTVWPATDLRLAVVNPFPELKFDFESLYFQPTEPRRAAETIEVHLANGLLPNQGIRLHWKAHSHELPERIHPDSSRC